MLNGFHQRSQAPELMDRPDADPAQLLRTVRQFTWTNLLFSRARTVLSRQILDAQEGSFSVLDVGAGGGDIMRWLVGECRRRGISVRVVCLDNDERITQFAQESCALYPEISVRTGDIRTFRDDENFDYVFCNNFLHHFADATIPDVLNEMWSLAHRGLIVSDIHRSQAAHIGYGLFAALFLHRSFARYDGLLSIRKGFRSAELRNLATRASLDRQARVDVIKLRPSRLILSAMKQQEIDVPTDTSSNRKGMHKCQTN